jgi:ABC-type polysaccharide/polyol phosphate export permease
MSSAAAPTTSVAAGELTRFRDLLLNLTWRDVRVRYKQSLLGIGWAVLLPLSMMLVFTFVFTRAVQLESVAAIRMPYALYAYVGLVPWTFFSNGLSASLNSLVANRNLITKVYFPREVFPLSAIAGALIDFCVAMIVLAGLIAYFHWNGSFAYQLRPAILLVPMVVLVQVALMIGLGMVLAMANLFYRDVRPIFSVVIQLWMFVSAVVVPVPADGGALAKWISANPLVPIIHAYRDCIIHGVAPNLAELTYAAAIAGAALMVGTIWFRRASWKFAECI